MLGTDTTSTTTTTNDTSIDSLPPKLLQQIFSHLPLGTLLRLHLVCKAWATVQSTLCASLHTLCLCIGDDVDDDHEILLNSQFSSSSFSIPHVEVLSSSDDEVVNSLSTSFSAHSQTLSSSLQFAWLDVEAACLIVNKLPNVRSLTLRLQSARLEVTVGERSWRWRLRLLDSLEVLFQKWSGQLVSLKLFAHFKVAAAEPGSLIVTESVDGLFRLVNGCSALRHLTVEGQNAFFLCFRNDQQNQLLEIDFPVFGWVEELYFSWWAFNSAAVRALVRHGPANRRLRSVNFTDFYELDLANTFGRAEFQPLLKCIHQFSAFQLCRRSVHWRVFGQNFRFLRKLWVGVFSDHGRRELADLAEVLQHMEQLLYVDLLWSCRGSLKISKGDEDGDGQQTMAAVSSVRILKFYATSLFCHSEIAAIRWETLFPNLEVLHFVDNVSCKRCDHEGQSGQKDCLQATLQAWSRCPRLRFVYSVSKNGNGGAISLTKTWDLEELFSQLKSTGELF